VTVAPELHLRTDIRLRAADRIVAVRRPGARETQAARRHGHFGLKSAPQHRDFRPGLEGDS
jgi:hypothetical protein